MECFLHTFHIARGVPHGLNKDLSSPMPGRVVHDTAQGFLPYLQEWEAQQGHSKTRGSEGEQSSRATGQIRAALEGERKRGVDAEHGRGEEREG